MASDDHDDDVLASWQQQPTTTNIIYVCTTAKTRPELILALQSRVGGISGGSTNDVDMYECVNTVLCSLPAAFLGILSDF